MNRFLKWLGNKLFPQKPVRKSTVPPTVRGAKPAPVRAQNRQKPKSSDPDTVEYSSSIDGRIEDGGPGKNVFVRSKYIREDTGTHDNLKIVDDSLSANEEENGLDPYNTGQFDRSKTWKLRS